MKNKRKIFRLLVTSILLISIFAFYELSKNIAFSQECTQGKVVCPEGQKPCCEKFKPHCKDRKAKCCKKKEDGSGLKCHDNDGNSYPVQCKESCEEGADEASTGTVDTSSTENANREFIEQNKDIEEEASGEVEHIALYQVTNNTITSIYGRPCKRSVVINGTNTVFPDCSNCSSCSGNPGYERCKLLSLSTTSCALGDGSVNNPSIDDGTSCTLTNMTPTTGFVCGGGTSSCQWAQPPPPPPCKSDGVSCTTVSECCTNICSNTSGGSVCGALAPPGTTPCNIPTTNVDPCPILNSCFRCLKPPTGVSCSVSNVTSNCYCGLPSSKCQTNANCTSPQICDLSDCTCQSPPPVVIPCVKNSSNLCPTNATCPAGTTCKFDGTGTGTCACIADCPTTGCKPGGCSTATKICGLSRNYTLNTSECGCAGSCTGDANLNRCTGACLAQAPDSACVFRSASATSCACGNECGESGGVINPTAGCYNKGESCLWVNGSPTCTTNKCTENTNPTCSFGGCSNKNEVCTFSVSASKCVCVVPPPPTTPPPTTTPSTTTPPTTTPPPLVPTSDFCISTLTGCANSLNTIGGDCGSGKTCKEAGFASTCGCN